MGTVKEYPAVATAYNKNNLSPLFSELQLVTFNSTTVLVPQDKVTADTAEFAGNANLSSGSVAPRAVIDTASSNGVALRPILFGEDSGLTDPAGKLIVMSLVRVTELPLRVGTAGKALASPITRIVRDWICTLAFQGGSGSGNSYLAPAHIREAVGMNQSDLGTNTAYGKSVFADSCSPIGGALLPTGLVRIHQTEWAVDVGAASTVEVYASCVNAATGTPMQTVAGVAALWRPVNL